MCKVLHNLELDIVYKNTVKTFLSTGPYNTLDEVDAKINRTLSTQYSCLRVPLKRDFTVPERNLVGWEPRCIGWSGHEFVSRSCYSLSLTSGRSDRILRMEAMDSNTEPASLKACPACKMAFYCSESHWAAVEHHHIKEPCADGHDGLTQCHMNQEIRQDIAFTDIMAKASQASFNWAPERIKSAWESLRGSSTNWEREYSAGLMSDFGIPAAAVTPFVRASSVGLSMPMTILWALEHLNQDDAWTRKKELSIHMIGAYEVEVSHARVFEEILHRLPAVETLRLFLCGPELNRLASPGELRQEFDMETCPNCASRRRKRIQTLSIRPYHEHANALGSRFTKPDLAVALNSGCSQDDISSWKPTISFLIENHIPSVFTAYNSEEAKAEAQILQSLGATLVQGLGPSKNPWGSISSIKEPGRVSGFYAVSGWLAGGFRPVRYLAVIKIIRVNSIYVVVKQDKLYIPSEEKEV
ncbi:hypothetical protein H0H92_001167 [Tricholoma furcatifolium]|nr:hypothetical protein H0H92_001167 [Tricholoma furcatifolium]